MNKIYAVLMIPMLACAALSEDAAVAPAVQPAAAPAAKPAKSAPKGAGLETEDQKTLYTLGVFLGQRLGQQIGVFHLAPSELKIVEGGFLDTLHGRQPKVDLAAYGPKLQEMAQKRAEAGSKKEKEVSQAFMDKMAKEKGAEKTASGLIYIPVKEGSGAAPKITDNVKVNYVGTLINGKEFDSSIKRGTPAEFPLNGVIPCWTEGVQKMKVGGSAKIVCPSELAYGDGGQPPTIPGGATLIFDVELLDIVKPTGEAEMPKKDEKAAKKEAKEADKFLAKMAKEKGAEKSDSGMIFISEKEGTGASPKATDTVKVNYAGTLVDGTEFDSSYKRGQPATFPLNRVIPCWTEGVQKLKIGGKAKLVCPSNIAYGERGAPPSIPGGATLVFEVELLDIVGAKAN
jgi:FKBP-type peptidyl-prolyl cis-trans isomerase FkpA